MTLSLQGRLRIAAGAVLAAFLGLTGLVLDHSFRQNADTALRERLEAHIYALLAAAELNGQGNMVLPRELAAPRFAVSASGLYADVVDNQNQTIWRSRSTIGMSLPAAPAVATGHWHTARSDIDGSSLFSLSFGSSWIHSDNSERRFVFRVSEDLATYQTRLADYRRNLWGGLAATTFLLLIVLGLILRWSLRPLRRAVSELKAIENGDASHMSDDYPQELLGLTANLNQLLNTTQAQLQRYREGLANLAHSLKTPMAVLRGAVEGEPDKAGELHDTALAQLQRMQNIVDYQLQHAATAGRKALTAPLALAPVAHKIITALQKVYVSKNIRVDIDVNGTLRWRMDEGDLYELLGNTLENAFKYCGNRVQLSASLYKDEGREAGVLRLVIEDDGPGIDRALAAQVLERGFRADTRQEGQGLGLAMTQNIVRLYDGTLSIERSPLGGAKLTLTLH